MSHAETPGGTTAAGDLTAMNLLELADHIEDTHHAYLNVELPRLDELTAKVAAMHGERDPRLRELRDTFLALRAELEEHLLKEENILFPMVRELERGGRTPSFHCGSIGNPIRRMVFEHEGAATALDRLGTLTDGFQAPDWACDTYRTLLRSLARFVDDMHEHIRKEEDALFPRALAMEADKRPTGFDA